MLHAVTLVRNKDIRKLYVQCDVASLINSLDGIYCTGKTSIVQVDA